MPLLGTRTGRATRARVATSVAALAAVVLVAAGCSSTSDGPDPVQGDAPGIFPDSVVEPLVEALPQRTIKDLPAARLAEGLIPPTNRWFSGLVFGEPSMPVFPLPLTFQLTDDGFAFGLPQIAAAEQFIMGGFAGHVQVDVGADSQVVTAYDGASVTIAQMAGDEELGSTVIARGWPFVAFTAAQQISVPTGADFSSAGDGLYTAELAGDTYGLVTDGEVAGSDLTLAAGDHATWFAVADGASVEDYAAVAGDPITGTSLGYGVSGGEAVTTIGYVTTGGGDTLVAALPHQAAGLVGSAECDLGSYPSVLGEMELCRLAELSWSVPELVPAGELDLSGLSEDQKAALATQVRADAADLAGFAADTYFGGKSLYKVVNLYKVAQAVGADDVAADLRAKVVAQIDRWTDPNGCNEREIECFVYDPAARGVVGLATSFGSDEFNDHHFHYGYHLYAAGVLAAEDPELVEQWAPVMNLLAADIGTNGGSSYFPDLRTFDVYGGHSWASGSSPFGDGNNQESSSEAVTAWNGLALWAQASGQAELETQARWMLSAEAASALAYWTNFPLDDPMYDGFDHTITSLVWGGKRDYATWFSAEPAAMLGILVLPMSPVADYLAVDPERVDINIQDSIPDGYDVMFGDFLLMYSALAGPDAANDALEAADSLPDERIDDGNTRSYMLAWLMAHAG